MFKGWVKLNTTNGHVSLNHDLFLPGIIATPESVNNIKAGGFTLKPVSECNGIAPYLESNTTDSNNSTYSSGTSTASTYTTTTQSVDATTTTDITGNDVSTTDGPTATDLSQSDTSAATSIYLVYARLLLLIMLAVSSAMFVL